MWFAMMQKLIQLHFWRLLDVGIGRIVACGVTHSTVSSTHSYYLWFVICDTPAKMNEGNNIAQPWDICIENVISSKFKDILRHGAQESDLLLTHSVYSLVSVQNFSLKIVFFFHLFHVFRAIAVKIIKYFLFSFQMLIIIWNNIYKNIPHTYIHQIITKKNSLGQRWVRWSCYKYL